MRAGARIAWELGPAAHRGLHDAARGIVENSAGAVNAALQSGFAIEVDLQITGDDHPVVFHDFTLDRLTDDTGPVRARTVQDVTRIGYTAGADRIMTLDALLEIVDGRAPLYIELKSERSGDMSLVRETARRLNAYPGPAALMSFDPRVMTCARTLAPRIPCGIVSGSYRGPGWSGAPENGDHRAGPWLRFYLRHILCAWHRRPAFVNYEIAAINALAPQFLRRLGCPLLAWTVRTPEDRAAAEKWADAIVFEGFVPAAPTPVPVQSAASGA